MAVKLNLPTSVRAVDNGTAECDCPEMVNACTMHSWSTSRFGTSGDDVRDVLAGRASSRGQSLQEYLRRLLIEAAHRRDEGDVLAGIRNRTAQMPIDLTHEQIVDAVHEGRR